MQRVRSERIPVNLPARINLAGRIYDGTIVNVSRDGVGSAVTSEVDVRTDFAPVLDIRLWFHAPSGDDLELECELVWFIRNEQNPRKITVGMRIIDPPPRYREFIKDLSGAALTEKPRDQLITELLLAKRRIAELESAVSEIGPHREGTLNPEDAYRSMVESTDDSIYIVDRECRYQYMNPTHSKRLNILADAYLGKPYREFHSTAEADEFARKVEEVFRSGASLRYEHSMNEHGKHFLRTISPIRGADGAISSVTVISKEITDRKLAEQLLLNTNQELDRLVSERTADLFRLNEELNSEITERKQTENALKQAAEDWRATFDSTKDMMMMLDGHFRIIRVNRATTVFLDRPYVRIIGENFFELFPCRDIERDMHPLLKMRRSGMHEESEIYFRERDLWVQALADPVLDDCGKITGAVHVIRDITEQKSLHSQLLHAQKMESVGRLAGGVAHDFNNLLSSILGYSELSLLKLSDDHPAKGYLAMVREAGEKAAALTHTLLAFSRKQVLQVRVLNLNRVIEGMVKMLSRIIREDISLVLRTSPEVRTILADPVQIEQILMNLIVNARDAMPNGGQLTIETADIELDRNFILRHEQVIPGPYVRLSVSDTGIGMNKEVQERIFEPFFTTKATGEGTGLGLATVYGIVTQHNGYIYVYSEMGKGTTFKIYLPAVEGEAAVPVESLQPSLKGGNETVLVVDDDPSIRGLIRDILDPLGYRLIFAGDGEEAMRASHAAPGRIDLLLTDLIMPHMNGRQLAELFRAQHPETRIIFMSGYGDETLVQHGELSADEKFLPKPLSPARLAVKIREVLDYRP